MRKVILKNLIWKEGKFYVAQCLNVNVSSFGRTRKSALKNLTEALELYFEDVKAPSITRAHSASIVETKFQLA